MGSKLPDVVIDVKSLTGAVNEAIKAGLTQQREYRRAITEDWLNFAERYAAIPNNPAPDAFALISAQYADDIPVGGDYEANADQLTDVRILSSNEIVITVRASTGIIVSGFDFSNIASQEIRAANRLQYRQRVTTGSQFIAEAKTRLGGDDLAAQLNVIKDIMDKIQPPTA